MKMEHISPMKRHGGSLVSVQNLPTPTRSIAVEPYMWHRSDEVQQPGTFPYLLISLSIFAFSLNENRLRRLPPLKDFKMLLGKHRSEWQRRQKSQGLHTLDQPPSQFWILSSIHPT